MANTYSLIEAKTLGSDVASVEFTLIPQIYTDLILKLSIRTAGSTGVTYAFNGMTANNTTTGYSDVHLYGDGSSPSSFANATATSYRQSIMSNRLSTTASIFASTDVYIPNYTGSTAKSISVDSVTEHNSASAYAILSANSLSNTAAITSLEIFNLDSDNFLTNSTFYLYGIKNS
jgi:hypothetical protein